MGVLFSVVLPTCNRRRFLVRCLQALEETLPQTAELILWDNASTDGTADMIAAWRERLRIRGLPLADSLEVVRHSENIGIDAYARAMRLARGPYLVSLDDDVIALPAGWAEKMACAFEREPRLGLLALDVVRDEKTSGGKPDDAAYGRVDYGGGLVLDIGPAGGWCCMTTRAVYDQAGGFPELGRTYYHHDGVYAERLRAAGYLTGILSGVRAYHACGEAWSRELGYAAEHRRKEAERAVVEGDLARREWRFDEALACLERARRWDPSIPLLHERLADCCLMMERYEEARAHLARAAAEDPDSERVLYVQGLSALRERRFAEALERLDRLVQRRPGDPGIRAVTARVRALFAGGSAVGT